MSYSLSKLALLRLGWLVVVVLMLFVEVGSGVIDCSGWYNVVCRSSVGMLVFCLEWF